MPIVTVNPVNTINVRVNQTGPRVVTGATTFVGSADVQQQVTQIGIVAQNASDTANTALSQVNAAYTLAQNAYDAANTKLSLSGGTITGSLIINQNLTVSNTIYANTETIDAGLF